MYRSKKRSLSAGVAPDARSTSRAGRVEETKPLRRRCSADASSEALRVLARHARRRNEASPQALLRRRLSDFDRCNSSSKKRSLSAGVAPNDACVGQLRARVEETKPLRRRCSLRRLPVSKKRSLSAGVAPSGRRSVRVEETKPLRRRCSSTEWCHESAGAAGAWSIPVEETKPLRRRCSARV